MSRSAGEAPGFVPRQAGTPEGADPTTSFAMGPLLCLGLGSLVLGGCATAAGGAPWGQLSDIRIERADAPPGRGLKLDLHAEYRLDNPLSRSIAIPSHRAWLEATPTDRTGAATVARGGPESP